MVAMVKPRTMAMTLMRISRAIETVDGEISMECLMLRVEKAMACLTATSERSIYIEIFGHRCERVQVFNKVIYYYYYYYYC